MRSIILLAALFCSISFSYSQSSVSLKKHTVGNSGCSVYNYCQPKYVIDYSTDSSKVYTGECVNGEVTYGLVCIKLLNPVTDLIMAEDLMIAYLDYLKGSFDITKAVGYARGHRLNDNENTRGILDYWEDAANDKWKIKAWTDGKFIGFLYAYSKKELPETKVDVFLNSFRMPESK